MDTPFPLNVPLKFYGVDGNRFKFGGAVYEVLEDKDDGYRSALGSVEVCDREGIFFGSAVDTVEAVRVRDGYCSDPYQREFDGWALRSVTDGHEWLRFGTEDYSDYYPCFVFRYSPRKEEVTP